MEMEKSFTCWQNNKFIILYTKWQSGNNDVFVEKITVNQCKKLKKF